MKFTRIACMFLLVVLATTAIAQQAEPSNQVAIKHVPIKYVNPSSGKDLYIAYCASCHGEDAMGTGPAASALKVPPTDLTMLTRRNHGTYPATHVYELLVGEATATIPAHGNAQMPVWGPLFVSLSGGSVDNGVTLRVANINNYLKSVQR